MAKVVVDLEDGDDSVRIDAVDDCVSLTFRGQTVSMPPHVAERVMSALRMLYTKIQTAPTVDQIRERSGK